MDVVLTVEDVETRLEITVELDAAAAAADDVGGDEGEEVDVDTAVVVVVAAAVELDTAASELVILGGEELELGVVDGGEALVLEGADDEDGGVEEEDAADELGLGFTTAFSLATGEGAGLLAEELATAELLPAPLKPPSKTTKFALTPLDTVTTQKLAPPAPSVVAPTISLTLFVSGSMAHGRPLHSPSHTISTPHVGI